MGPPQREHYNIGHQFVGCLDFYSEGVARGWGFDRAQPERPITLHVLIDEQEVGTISCDRIRHDVREALGHPTGAVGFCFTLPSDFHDGEPHRLGFRYVNRGIVPQIRPDGVPKEGDGWLMVRETPPVRVRGHVDGLNNGLIRGWALREATDGTLGGDCQLLVTCDGTPMAQVRANRYRADVAAAFGCGPNCGFQLAVPRDFRTSHAREFRFQIVPDDVELDNSPFRTGAVDDQLHGRLVDMSARVDALYRELVALRRDIVDLLPAPGYSLDDYDRWARDYRAALRARVDAMRPGYAGVSTPLVSVLMPAFRPLIVDFNAAVESVLAQTWSHWELVIVDDGSADPALTEAITRFADRDDRVHSLSRAKQGGISRATTTAIKAARGEWIAFFDHDDLLSPVALEVMMREAQRTGALMLFSDEDKVDQAGFHLEPNLKPDWNHRYMLGCNYVCHFLVVAAPVARNVAPLRPIYDGAQDHDFILRVAEAVGAKRIHHVAEVLYHWRKTPNSTAVDVGRKDYAKRAGVRAVSDHLARLGRPATVDNIRGLTLYRVNWQFEATPSVSIVIPFKDQTDMTRRCVSAILELTDYTNYEIVLVDNWSVTTEAELWCIAIAEHPRVRVLRVEERFNYSRLNNLAAAGSDATRFVFMNNDVLITSRDWLRRLVDETLADPEIAAVGGRFLYPNGTVQHAGVVVGLPGIAAHGHRGAIEGDYGFVGRLMLSHEVTVVSAACMLVCADRFREVGGFDETALAVAYNDVDLCLKLRARDLKVVYCAEFVAEHHESLSRGSDDLPQHEARFFHETQTIVERWGEQLARDPHYSPFFTVDKQPFFDLKPPFAEPHSDYPITAPAIAQFDLPAVNRRAPSRGIAQSRRLKSDG